MFKGLQLALPKTLGTQFNLLKDLQSPYQTPPHSGGAQSKSEVKYHDFIKDLTIENYIFEDVKEIVRDVKEIVKEGTYHNTSA